MTTGNSAPAPGPRDVADHEASHAVVWWWHVNQPNGFRVNNQGSYPYVTIKTRHGRDWGHFQSPDPLNMFDRTEFEQAVMSALAGAAPDDIHKRHFLKAKQEELWAAGAAVRLLGGSEHATMTVRELRGRIRTLLERPEVRAMVDAVTAALLKRETLSGAEAIAVMRQALGDT